MKTKLKVSLLNLIISFYIFSSFSCNLSIPEKAYNDYSVAVAFYMKGDNEKAIRILEQILNKYPHFYEVSAFYGRVLFYSERYSEAIICLENLLQDSVNIDSAKLLARAYLRENDADNAGKVIEKALEYSSEDPELLYLSARYRIASNDPKEALALLTAACSHMERQIEIPLELASLYMHYGLYSDAADLVEQYLNVLKTGHPLKRSIENLNTELQLKKKTRP